jgi:hypothetical protein
MTTTTKTKSTKKSSAPEYVDGPLSILYSCRLRLQPEQRQTLKDALNEFRLKHAPQQQTESVIPGASISVVTNHKVGQNVYSEYGLSDLIVADLIQTRESVRLALLVKLQQMLGVDVIDRKELETKFKGYLDYVLK